MTSNPPSNGEKLRGAVRTRLGRRALWQREGERPLAKNLAMVGTLGWTIVLPMLIGIFGGRWLDHRFNAGVFWTLGLLVFGLGLGGVLAWKRIMEE